MIDRDGGGAVELERVRRCPLWVLTNSRERARGAECGTWEQSRVGQRNFGQGNGRRRMGGWLDVRPGLPSRSQPSDHRKFAADASLLVPEGRRRKLAGGKTAPAGAAPGYHAEQAMPQRGIGEVFGVTRSAASPAPLVTSGSRGRWRLVGVPGHFFDAPLGHRAPGHGFRGPRPLARTCPRLISSGVPPGLEPGRHGLTTVRETARPRGAHPTHHFTGTVTERLVALPKKSLHCSVIVYTTPFLGRRKSLSGPVMVK